MTEFTKFQEHETDFVWTFKHEGKWLTCIGDKSTGLCTKVSTSTNARAAMKTHEEVFAHVEAGALGAFEPGDEAEKAAASSGGSSEDVGT